MNVAANTAVNAAVSACELTPRGARFDAGGYYTLRRNESWALLRCHSFRDRPGQCDPLQLDLWWRGRNVLQDTGLHKYYVPGRPDVENYFRSIAAHNTLELDGRSPMTLMSRFLWFPWLRARLRWYDATGDVLGCEGEHYGYAPRRDPRIHRRTVLSLPGEAWVIVDDVLGGGVHDAVLRWHLADVPCTLESQTASVQLAAPEGPLALCVTSTVATPPRVELVRGRLDAGRVLGWAAPYYGQMQPIPTFVAGFRDALPLRILTTVAAGAALRPQLVRQTAATQEWACPTAAAGGVLTLATPQPATARTFVAWTPAARDTSTRGRST